MNNRSSVPSMRNQNFTRRKFLNCAASLTFTPLVLSACAGGPLSTDSTRAKQRNDIQTDFYVALDRFHSIVPESRALIAKSVGVLVFPVVISTNPLTGEQTGVGALRVGDAFTSYYSITLDRRAQIAGSRDIILLFKNFDALVQFRKSNSWRVGEMMIAVPTMSANGIFHPGKPNADLIVMVIEGGRLVANPLETGMRVKPYDIS